ncbi:transcription elongation factor 1 family protein [Eubacteriales bacterium OttesenSCG-928-M02]|nr:transcription elongation factor 1 family protein [Eubacteriales bacterium OttesenSCG-928-M02]
MGFLGWLQRVMMGRNGVDQLSIGLMIFYFIATMVTRFAGVYGWPRYLTLLPLAWAFFRMMSRNIPKRQKENAAFVKIWGSIRSWWYRISQRYRAWSARQQDKRSHKFFKCPNCKEKCRVPKGKGKIRITCPNCGEKFDKKT